MSPDAARTDPPAGGIWPLVHAERAALAADLADLTAQQWEMPSLCAGLTVREVLAHLTAGASLGPARWLAGVVRCRFDFDKMVALRLAEQLGSAPAETLTRFRRVITSTVKAPVPTAAVLGETIVHAEDIRRPLGLRHDYPMTALTRVAGYFHGSDLVVPARKRASGLRLQATDGSFAAGSGLLVSGATLPLIMAMTGRGAYCDDLTGDGLPTLRARCRASRNLSMRSRSSTTTRCPRSPPPSSSTPSSARSRKSASPAAPACPATVPP